MRIRDKRINPRHTARFVTLSTLNIVEPRLRWIAQLFEEWLMRIEAESSAEEAIDQFLEICDEIGVAIPEVDSKSKKHLIRLIADDDIESTPENTYPASAHHIFSHQAIERQNAIAVYSLCYEVNRETNSADKFAMKKAIEQSISDFDFIEPGEPEIEFLRGFEATVLDGPNETHSDIFEDRLKRDTKDVIEQFLKNYTVDTFSFYLLRTQTRVEDLRSTLAQLIREGKLNIGNLTTDVINEKLEDVRSDLEETEREFNGYFVLSHRLLNADQEATQRLYARFPLTLWVKSTEARGFIHESTTLNPAFHIVFTSQRYSSADEFLDRGIAPILPPNEEWDDYSMVAVVPFETSPDYSSLPNKDELISRTDSTWWSGTISENFEIVGNMVGERSTLATVLTVDEVVAEAKVEEVLRVIPINVFVPEISMAMKDVILEHYETLKNRFEIESIFDWAYVNKEDLANALIEVDKNDIADSEDWFETSKQIVEAARECSEATFP